MSEPQGSIESGSQGPQKPEEVLAEKILEPLEPLESPNVPVAAVVTERKPIEVEKLVKRFGNVTAVRDLSFSVGTGEICALVGPNGAGKTSTMRVLATLSRPDSGSAYIEGVDCWRQMRQVRAKMGYMPDRYGLYKGLPVKDYLELFASAYGIAEQQKPELISGLLDLTGLNDVRENAADSLSMGMKQRFFLARTLVHSPSVLILDEPAANLDPRARVELRDILRELQSRGVTILISSHILSELQDICDQVVILERGMLVHAGSIDEAVVGTRENPAVRIDINSEAEVQQAVSILEGLDIVKSVKSSENSILVEFSGGQESIAAISAALVMGGVIIERLAEDQASLEELFMILTKGELH
jgi:ABC-2 type transport system ATP-binding protein